MAHSNTWADAPLAISDQAGEGYANINDARTDVSERLQLEHHFNNSASDGNNGLDTDGLHLPGKAAVVENQSTAATIVANGGDFLAAYNGSIAVSSDTKVPYVKVGAEEATNGTWTLIGPAAYTPVSMGAATESVTMPNGFIIKMGEESTAATTGVVTFGVAFPNAVYSITATPHSSATGTENVHVYSVTTAGFTVYHNTNERPTYWVAYGY